MDKLDDKKMDKVAGGKVTEELVKDKFMYRKKICDECGKVMVERMDPINNPHEPDLNFDRSGYLDYHFEKDHGFTDKETQWNICKDCFRKKFRS